MCALCGLHALDEEPVFIIETDCVHCQARDEAEETDEHQHIIQYSKTK